MEWGNVRHLLSGGPRARELRETRAAWDETERLWSASPFGSRKSYEFAIDFMKEACGEAERLPATPIMVAFSGAIDDLICAEHVTAIEADWPVIEQDVAAASEVRAMLARRRRWSIDHMRMLGILRRQVLSLYRAFFDALPESCFSNGSEQAATFEVPLIEVLEDPAAFIEALLTFAYTDDTLRFEMFLKYREVLVRNLLAASGFQPDDNPHEHSGKLKGPSFQKGKTGRELAEIYLAGTPFAGLLELPIPFRIPDGARFEHCHIVGGTGHGKTQLMQRMIHADLVAARVERRSVVVIDSQGDLINKLTRLDLFSPETPGSLANRLVLIDPSDVEFPASLNLFDAHLERAEGYRPVDRERILNGVIELYEIFFGGLLGAELTQKQGVIFKYLARLMLTIPGATIHTLMRLMEDGKPFRPHMERLEGSAAYFFATEFFHPSFAATKKQILRRLWGVLSTPAFERMFAQTQNKLDLFEALNEGKIILINTAKDLLKEEGSQLFGRFFIALLSQAALERSTIPADERTPTFVYVDEAQEYFDDRIEIILTQARKYAISFHCAHQSLDQPSPRIRAALMSNTSFKCVGGVSARDARALADELRTTPDFIEGMRRRKDRTEFAVWLKHLTPSAIRLSVPLGYLERQPLLTEEAYESLLKRNRVRYCGTLADVTPLSPQFLAPEVAERPVPKAEDGVAQRVEMPTQPDPDAHDERRREDIAATGGEASFPLPPQPPEVSERPMARPEERLLPPINRDPSVQPSPRVRPKAPEPGKGGSQHKYVQHLIKQLATERGFRAVIEEAVEGGQVDVALYREGVSIACEISVSSTPVYEAQNLAKCLRSGFTRIWAVAADAKRSHAIERAAKSRLSEEEFARIEFLAPDDVILLLDAFTEPATEETVVRGYKVKVNRKAVSVADAKDRRATIARVIAQSIGDLA